MQNTIKDSINSKDSVNTGQTRTLVDIASVEVAPPMIAKAVMLSMIAASYYCMSLALRKIALGVAYSVWEIVGMIGILFISFLFFPPNLTLKEYIGIAVGFVGIICVILGEEPH